MNPTARRAEVAAMRAAGHSSHAIAARLGISVTTVKRDLEQAPVINRRAIARFLATPPTGPGWIHTAACRAEDPETFFPYPTDLIGVTSARKICGACPARRDCGQHALDEGITDGIWGGLTEDERQILTAGDQAQEGAAA